MISVVIPAYNEERYLEACLEALTAQHTTQPFAVIVVDNNSTDDTAAIAERYGLRLNLHLIREPRKGRGAARAAGFAAAQGDIILSTDADTTVPPTWVEEMTDYFRDETIGAVSGTCYITDLSPHKNTAFNWLQPTAMKLHRVVFGNYWLTGSNFAIRRSVYVLSGGFNQNLNSQEDTQLSFAVRKVGKIKYISRPAVQVSGRRFKKSYVAGLWDYVRTFFERHLLRQADTYLSDDR